MLRRAEFLSRINCFIKNDSVLYGFGWSNVIGFLKVNTVGVADQCRFMLRTSSLLRCAPGKCLSFGCLRVNPLTLCAVLSLAYPAWSNTLP